MPEAENLAGLRSDPGPPATDCRAMNFEREIVPSMCVVLGSPRMAQLKKRRPLFPAQTYREKRPENWRTDCYSAGRPAPVYCYCR
jgi:hypothetical protein